jgi:hypothetical protein
MSCSGRNQQLCITVSSEYEVVSYGQKKVPITRDMETHRDNL